MADNKLGPAEVDAETFASSVFEDGGSIMVDLSNVEEMKFELMPKGIYDAEIDQLDFGQSKSSGHNMFTFIFVIDGGEYAGRKLYYYASFSPKALRGTKTALLRIDPELFAGQFDPQKIVDSGVLLGKKVKLRVTTEKRDDTGEDQNRIGQILPASAAGGSNGGDSFFNS